jgi:heptosyltransferase-2
LGHSQERWLTHGPFLPRSLRPAHRIVKLAALEAAHGLHVESREPSLKVDQALSQAVRTSFAVLPRPWIVFGVGASEASKRWPLDRYAALAETLAGATTFWLGGPDEGPAITDASATVSDAGATCVNISDWTLDRAAALMQVADLFVGGDSGPMNVSASVGRPTLALFGATPRLEYSRFITPIGDGISGMGAISVSAVAAEAKALLTPS